jgi:hypothetical protein
MQINRLVDPIQEQLLQRKKVMEALLRISESSSSDKSMSLFAQHFPPWRHNYSGAPSGGSIGSTLKLIGASFYVNAAVDFYRANVGEAAAFIFRSSGTNRLRCISTVRGPASPCIGCHQKRAASGRPAQAAQSLRARQRARREARPQPTHTT